MKTEKPLSLNLPMGKDGTSEKFVEGITAFNNELQFDGWNIFWDDKLSDISAQK